ncbi:MAG: hypothetical protein QOH13_308, partial [Thermoleophilaceae bacterium]|nr:hypothetical protein [Thermoleophilaceae bacterium]
SIRTGFPDFQVARSVVYPCAGSGSFPTVIFPVTFRPSASSSRIDFG